MPGWSHSRLLGAGEHALMPDDRSSRRSLTGLRAWAGTLPLFASTVVSSADTTRPHIYTQTSASRDQVSVLRGQIIGWIQRVGVPDAIGQDVVLATDEAVSNAVEHAYPDSSGIVTLFAACIQPGNAVGTVVADHGRWRTPPAIPGLRGRGLAMMETLAHACRLMNTPHGTTVVLGWSLPGWSQDGNARRNTSMLS
jgi:serine/threonine-protein kinase RsbW